MLEITHKLPMLYWATIILLGGFGGILFPILVWRNALKKMKASPGQEEYLRHTAPGSELLQIGTCALLFFIHFDVRIGFDVLAMACMALGFLLLRRQWSPT